MRSLRPRLVSSKRVASKRAMSRSSDLYRQFFPNPASQRQLKLVETPRRRKHNVSSTQHENQAAASPQLIPASPLDSPKDCYVSRRTSIRLHVTDHRRSFPRRTASSTANTKRLRKQSLLFCTGFLYLNWVSWKNFGITNRQTSVPTVSNIRNDKRRIGGFSFAERKPKRQCVREDGLNWKTQFTAASSRMWSTYSAGNSNWFTNGATPKLETSAEPVSLYHNAGISRLLVSGIIPDYDRQGSAMIDNSTSRKINMTVEIPTLAKAEYEATAGSTDPRAVRKIDNPKHDARVDANLKSLNPSRLVINAWAGLPGSASHKRKKQEETTEDDPGSHGDPQNTKRMQISTEHMQPLKNTIRHIIYKWAGNPASTGTKEIWFSKRAETQKRTGTASVATKTQPRPIKHIVRKLKEMDVRDISALIASTVSSAVGASVGSAVSAATGPAIGLGVGAAVGTAVGPAVGSAVGTRVEPVLKRAL